MIKTIAGPVASTAALTLALAGAANAEPYGIDEPMDTWHGSDIQHGDYIMRIDYRSDGTSHGLADWVGEPRSYSLWVARG